MNTIEIPFSKKKLVVGTAVSLVLILGGIYFLSPISVRQLNVYSYKIKMIGFLSIGLGVVLGSFCGKKVFDKKPGLILDQSGITDNSSVISVGLILWAQIAEVSVKNVLSKKLLLISVYDAESFLTNANAFQKAVMKENVKQHGTPITIDVTALQCSFEDLEKFVKNSRSEYAKSSSEI